MKQSLLVTAPPSSRFLELCLDPLALLPPCSAQIGVSAFTRPSSVHCLTPHLLLRQIYIPGHSPSILTSCFPPKRISAKDLALSSLSSCSQAVCCLRIYADSPFRTPSEPHKPLMTLIHKHLGNWILNMGLIVLQTLAL